MRKIFNERFNMERIADSKAFWRRFGSVMIAIVLTLLVMTGCSNKEEEVIEDPTVDIMQSTELPKENINTVNDGISGAIASDDIEIMPSSKMQPGSSMVTMAVEDVGRLDPFLPANSSSIGVSGDDYLGSQAALLPPPQTITVDTTATEVIGTKVSGIMYDTFNPSAIINISGSDYLVRTGDMINGYKVLAIAREVVTVQNGENIYKAGVGELFTGEGIKHNTVSNLEAKFGGRQNVVNMEQF